MDVAFTRVKAEERQSWLRAQGKMLRDKADAVRKKTAQKKDYFKILHA